MVFKVTFMPKTAPNDGSNKKDINMDNGIAIPTKAAFRTPKKNIKTPTTKITPRIMEFSNSLT